MPTSLSAGKPVALAVLLLAAAGCAPSLPMTTAPSGAAPTSPTATTDGLPAPTTDLERDLTDRLAQYTTVRLTADLSGPAPETRQMLPLLIAAAREMDAVFWQQAYGDLDALLAPRGSVQRAFRRPGAR